MEIFQYKPATTFISGQGIVDVCQLGQLACAVYFKTLYSTGGVRNDSTCYCNLKLN
jgi:hypothetical protein